MATFIRVNQRTGQREEVDEQTGEVIRTLPPTTPEEDNATMSQMAEESRRDDATDQTPPTDPELEAALEQAPNADYQPDAQDDIEVGWGEGFMDQERIGPAPDTQSLEEALAQPGMDVQNPHQPAALSSTDGLNTRTAPPEQGTLPTVDPTADIGQPPLRNRLELPPEVRQRIERLTAIQEGFGAIQMPGRAEMPPAPQLEYDAGAQLLADRARERDTETDTFIAEQRALIQEDRDRANNKWLTLGRFFSEWGASGDLSSAGVAMYRALDANADMRRSLRQEEIALMELGMNSEDAAVQAQANLLSGRSIVNNQNAVNRYNRDVADVQSANQHSLTQYNAESNAARTQADLAATIAEIEANAYGTARQQQTQAMTALTQVPDYAPDAWDALARNAGITDPNARGAFVRQQEQQQVEAGLMAYIDANAGTQNNRQFLRTLRQFDSRITENDIRNQSPRQLFMRVMNSPNADAILRANGQQFARYARFAAVAPEQ